MDARKCDGSPLGDEFVAGIDRTNEDFLLREGLEVLAAYRSIRNDAVRLAIRDMITTLAKATEDLR